MMYCDTSVLIPVLVTEPSSEDVAIWLAGQPPATLTISDWTDAEVASALAMKVRAGALTADLRSRAEEAWRAMAAGMLRLDVVASDSRSAAALVDSGRGLRAGDALHVAIPRRAGAALATLDQRMAVGAAAAGLEVSNPAA